MGVSNERKGGGEGRAIMIETQMSKKCICLYTKFRLIVSLLNAIITIHPIYDIDQNKDLYHETMKNTHVSSPPFIQYKDTQGNMMLAELLTLY